MSKGDGANRRSKAQKVEYDKVYRAIDSYQDTVHGLVCFAHVLTWDDRKKCFKPESRRCFGRSMTPSENNRVQSKDAVTPDLVVVCTQADGVVGEAKISFHGTVDDCHAELRQLVKYDDDLKGWPTSDGTIKSHDLVLLVHYSRKGEAKTILDAAKDAGILKLHRKFSAVCFSRMAQAAESLSLEHFYGEMTDKKLRDRMQPLFVPLEKVRPLNPASLYDAEPEPAFMLYLTWDLVFSQLVNQEDFTSLGKKVFEIECTIDQVRGLLAQACAPKAVDELDPPIPKRDWVRKTFDYLIRMKLAKCLDPDNGRYQVNYRRKASPLKYFIERYVSITKVKPKLRVSLAAKGRRRKGRPDHPGQGVLFK